MQTSSEQVQAAGVGTAEDEQQVTPVQLAGSAGHVSAGGRVLKTIGAIVLAVVIAAVCNAVLTFAIEPYGSKSEVMWTDYAKTEQLDCVYVGTSLTARAFDPSVVDAALGTNSYNMATPGQYLEESLVGIQTAYEQKHVKRVVLGFQFSVLRDEDPSPASAYLHSREKAVSKAEALAAVGQFMFSNGGYKTTGSINWLFPWVKNHVELNPGAIRKNIKMRTDGTDIYKAAMANEPGWKYYGSGYGNYKKSMDYNGEKVEPYLVYDEEAADFEPARVAALEAIFDYCHEKDIEIIVAGIPIPVFNIMNYGLDNYFAQQAAAREIFERNGVEFYDFNMAAPDLMKVEADYFFDAEHFNIAGGKAFSEAFVQLMRARAAGEDTSKLFYTNDQYAASLDYISATLLAAEGVSGGLKATATALCGPSVQPEYQFLVKQGKKWKVVRDYSSEPEFTYHPEKRGKLTIRVNVRKAGSAKEYDHYRELKTLY